MVQETLDEAVCGINDLQDEFFENDSEIETVRGIVLETLWLTFLEWFGIPIDMEQAIRERDWVIFMKIEPPLSTAVFWRGGEKIDLNGRKPDAVRCLSVTGERKADLSFLRDYPNLEELSLMEKCEGVEVLSELRRFITLSLWLSAPVSWNNISLPGLRVLHLRGEKNGDITPLLSSITYLHLEEMRKTEDLAPFLTAATRLQKLYLQSLPAVQELPALDGLPSLYALKLYELHKLSDLSALSHSHLRYFAASLIGDQLSAQALADAVMTIPNLEAAALQLADRSSGAMAASKKPLPPQGSPHCCGRKSVL